jgi:diacylglycerol kinase family enzyme
MCSVGCDAGVIGRMAARREGSIGHLSYLGPMLSEAWSPSLSPMTISVDGRTVVEGRRGLAVIANSRQYALRVDPALRASVSDGLLDVVFFPGASSAEMLLWVLRSRLRRHVRSRRLEYRTGRSVVVTDHGGALPTQLDGEAAARTQGEIAISVEPGALAVLLP